MNITKAFSFVLRAAALGGALAALVSPARSAAFQASQPPVPVPNLVGYWPLDTQTGGVTPDQSGTSPANNGTLTGAAAISTANFAPAPPGNTASLAIAGTANDIVIVPDSNSLSVTGSFTLAAWIRPTLAPGGNQKGIIEKWDWSGSYAQNGYMMRLDSVNNLSFAVCGPTGNMGISTAPRAVPSAGAWTHVAATFDSATGNMVMYVGGNPDPTTGNAAGGTPANGGAELHIGADYGANRFGGNIDEARVYTRALTQAEIGILMTGQNAPTGLVAAGQPGQIGLIWTAPTGPAPTSYSLLRGTSPGNYTTIINNIATTSYNDTSAIPGTTYYYAVVAVSVMASANSNESSASATIAGPPPPPPAPRTGQVGGEDNPCGCGMASPISGWGVPVAALAAALLGFSRRRRAKA